MKIFAHRGASGYYKDNSKDSIIEAFQQGSDYIELDIQICQSGELVFSHDLTIPGSDLLIAQMSLKKIRELDPEILDLSQVLDLMLDSQININCSGLYLDLKSHYLFEETFFQKLIDELALLIPQYYQIISDDRPLMIASFNHDLIQRLIKWYSSKNIVKNGILWNIHFGVISYSSPMLDYLELLKDKYGVRFFVLDYRNLRKNLVEKLNELGISILLYTINNAQTLKTLIDSKSFDINKIQGIVTNYPKLMDSIYK